MSDSLPDPDISPLLRHLAEALNLPDWEHLSDAELESLLDSTATEPFTEAEHDHILEHAQQLIFSRETDTMEPQPNRIKNRPHAAPTEPVSSGSSQQPGGGKSKLSPNTRTGSGSAVVIAGIVLLAVGALFLQSDSQTETVKTSPTETQADPVSSIDHDPLGDFLAMTKPAPPVAWKVELGSKLTTMDRERKRVSLPDGSIVYLNENTSLEVAGDRKLIVTQGEVFVEVVPQHLVESKTHFVVETPNRKITALGTKFVVKASKLDTDVLVTQGKVKISDAPALLTAGQQLKNAKVLPAPRASEALLWTKELMAKAESPLIPKNQHAGGALVAVDPSGQEMKLSLRKQHIDVHIEDGFARTTIDQTYFNASWGRMEGTFYFPLPADASLSRLAMYVGENLMEGGMAERNHARNVFEQIRYTRRDPALLEWVDGSTFKMRVFPLEARQEKRIVISYTQRLHSAYGQTHYRFPAGHSLELIGDWSTHVLVKNHAQKKWDSPSHDLKSSNVEKDLVLEAAALRVVDDRDIVLALEEEQNANSKQNAARFSRVTFEGQQYLMLRYRPDLQGELQRKPRNWVFLFESAGNRNSLLARVQIDVLNTLLKNAEHHDTFSVVTSGTRSKTWKSQPVSCTAKNIQAAVEFLNHVHLIGALDLEKGLAACKPLFKAKAQAESYLVHLGAGVAVLGEKAPDKLISMIPTKTKYVGVGVGKRWSQDFMKTAADKREGVVTSINPDEEITWRAIELLSLLNAPRLVDVKVTDDQKDRRYLQFAETVAQGEELCVLTRFSEKDDFPKTLTITGKLAGQEKVYTLPVKDLAEKAGYLPRTWAKLEIDRLVAAGAEQHKDEIIKLSKAMYVMSPFTSLLVLETEQMYQQFKVDRGRKDHWALYPCPDKIKVVYEPGIIPANIPNLISTTTRAKSAEDVLQSVLVRTPPMTYRWNNGQQTVLQGLNAMQLYKENTTSRVHRRFSESDWITRQIQLSDDSSMDGLGLMGPRFLPVLDYNIEDTTFEGENRLFGVRRNNFNNLQNFWMEEAARNNTFFTRTSFGRPGVRFGQQNPVTWSREPKSATTATVPLGWRSVNLNWDDGNWRLFSTDGRRSVSYTGTAGPFYPFTANEGWVTAWPTYPQSGNGAGIAYPSLTNGRWNMWGKDQLSTTLEAGQSGQVQFWPSTEGSERMLGVLPQLRGANGEFSGGGGFGYLPSNMLGSGMRDLNTGFMPAGLFQDQQVGRLIVELSDDLILPALDDWPANGTIVGLAPAKGFLFGDIAGQIGGSPQWMNGNWTIGRFGDLTAHAPGMNTMQVDVPAQLESHGPTKLLPKRGTIDPKAKALIDRARQHGWESITLPQEKGETAFVLQCDGQGRYTYHRVLSEGLQEQVLSDGQTLRHLYPEIGLGATRVVSRFHRAEIQRLVPWLVAPAQDLAVGCNVNFVNDHTIALVPLQKANTEQEQPSKTVSLLLIFGDNGQLIERQLVEVPTGKKLLRVTYDDKGNVTVFNHEDKQLAKAQWKRGPVKAPNLEPDVNELVVLSLPFRSPGKFSHPDGTATHSKQSIHRIR